MKYLKSGFFHFLSSLFIAIKTRLWKWYPKQKTRIKILPNFSFWFQTKGEITKILFLNQHLVSFKKSFEFQTLTYFESHIKPQMTVLDIGANVGLFSLLASKKMQNTGQIIAFEPSQDIFKILKYNLAANQVSNVIVEKLALSSSEGEISLVTPNKEFSDAFSHISFTKSNSNAEESVEKVPMTTIDLYLEKNRIEKVDFVKIDIEGAELMALKGATKLLSSKNKPTIIFESVEAFSIDNFGNSTYDLLHFLHSYEYTIRQIEYNQWVAIPQ